MAIHWYIKQIDSPKRKAINYFSYITLIVGLLLLFWSFYPILSFEIYSRLFLSTNLATPIPLSEKASSLKQAASVLGSFNFFSNNLKDFTDVSLWFPSKPQIGFVDNSKIKEYFISIPKLNIKDAKVIVGAEDLSKSLIHYLPRSMPGEIGNVAIFGHSTLPQFYKSNDYKSIFTFLSSLEKEDKIYVKVDKITYQYIVYEMFVVNPEEISVLEQKNDDSYLTLITCVPPGTYWKRLVVRARLSQLPLSN